MLHDSPRPSIALLCSLACALSTACGGTTSSPADGGSQTDGGPVDAGGSDDGPWSPICPASAPTVGSACDLPQKVYCEYGNAWWNPSCDIVVSCYQGYWGMGFPGGGTCLPEPGPNPMSCPMNYGMIVAGQSCADKGLQCYYGQGPYCRCDAYPPNSDAGPTWHCVPGTDGCPASRPRFGAPCDSIGMSCDYQLCGAGQVCINGTWQPQNGGC